MQREAYREIYTTLMSEDLHRGRWLINNIPKTDVIPKDKDYRLIYRTLGVFDNMAMFARQKVVPLKWVLEVWHHPLSDMRKGAEIIRQNAMDAKRVLRNTRYKIVTLGDSRTNESLVLREHPALLRLLNLAPAPCVCRHLDLCWLPSGIRI
jgi:hypothetical protein